MGLHDVADIQKKGGVTKEKMEETKTSSLRRTVYMALEKQCEKEELDEVSTKELATSFVEDGSYPSRVIRVFTGLF